jgi:glycosyltransferase involved in cell wall biosynthesis
MHFAFTLRSWRLNKNLTNMDKNYIRILELCLSPAYGGLELHVRDFCVWLAGQPQIELFLVLKNESPIYQDLKKYNRPTLTFDRFAGKFPLAMALHVARYIDAHKIDVVHMHWKDDLPLAALAKRLCKRDICLVSSRHMLLPHKKHDIYHRFIYQPVDRYITITKDLKMQAEKNLPIDSNKIEVIYYGVKPPDMLTPEKIAELKTAFNIDNRFTVGLIGRICPEKRQELFIKAIQKLNEEDVHIHGLIIGSITDQPYYEHIRQYVKDQQIENIITFSGFYNRPTDLMQCLDVLVMTSGVETFGLVLIEAMHCGIPVIGSNKGGVPEIIDHGITGLMFESDDLLAFTEEIGRLYNDEALRRQLAKAGQQKAGEMFVADNQYQKVKSALERCIKR